jgi:glucose-6-phosphate-specific signal transduction histidine kinase
MRTDIGTIKSRIFNARKNVIKRINPRLLDELGIGKEITNGN